MSALRVTQTPAEFMEHQMREALDGTFVVFHWTGRFLPLRVAPDFDPFSPEGEKIIRRHCDQKVIQT